MVIRWIPVERLDLAELRGMVEGSRLDDVERAADAARSVLRGRGVVHVNATATGGGVAEMLPTLLGYARGCGIDARWAVISGDPGFFQVTKRLHNRLHGQPGDAGSLGPQERRLYDQALLSAGPDLLAVVGAADVVVLHDPQTLGLAPMLRDMGVRTVWRCHIGADATNANTEQGWDFLDPYLAVVDRVVFSRADYRPSRVPAEMTAVIAPALDPRALKNRPLSTAEGRELLSYAGLLQGPADRCPVFVRRDGSPARLQRRADIIQLGPPPAPDQPLVVQVSRWDRLKDMSGVITGFAEHVATRSAAHLMVVGPNVSGVADDPEGAGELQRCIGTWQGLPHAQRQRVHLACLPVADPDENAVLVNALQRHAAVVTQKSVAEGFGLTVAEAMWKGKPVVASRVGGIRDQISDGRSGLLLDDPGDLRGFGRLICRLLEHPELAASIGRAAAQRAAEFLPDRSLLRWWELLRSVVDGAPSSEDSSTAPTPIRAAARSAAAG